MKPKYAAIEIAAKLADKRLAVVRQAIAERAAKRDLPETVNR